MALNDVLTSLDGARDALVTAINAKGGSLVDNATLYQCADAVGSLSGGGTSAEYYKCASVDTSAKTWTGYKAVQQANGGYTFEETATTGLTYTTITPFVDSIYTADVMLKVGYLVPAAKASIPDDSLKLYAPLETSNTPTTGNEHFTTNVTYTTKQGLACAYFDGTAYLQYRNIKFTNRSSGKVYGTYSLWGLTTANTESLGILLGTCYDFHFGLYVDRAHFWHNQNLVNYEVTHYLDTSVFHHYAVTFNGRIISLYIDGVKVGEVEGPTDFHIAYEQERMYLGCHSYSNSANRLTGYITALRAYDRTLTDAEILALAGEFTPTA